MKHRKNTYGKEDETVLLVHSVFYLCLMLQMFLLKHRITTVVG